VVVPAIPSRERSHVPWKSSIKLYNCLRLLLGSGVVTGPSRHQAGDERSEQGFAASACVVHELEEAEIKRQLVLRNASMRAKPGTQQRPEPLHRVDVDFAKAIW
jgi:hypothetical protein